VKFVAISDTHGKHADVVLPSGDILIHAGDVSMKGEEQEVMDFLQWFDAIKGFQYKILVAGNHDFYFERNTEEQINKAIPADVIYLKDSGTSVNGINIWGSPVTPWFLNWAFNVRRGDPIRRYWDLIPGNTDILITHGPPFRVLDTNYKGEHLGCKDLFNRLQELKPRVHIFGHIHESYGMVEKPGTTFINASILNEKYELANQPVIFEL
jgi:Icc-related predicted phosphoesterase